MSFVVVLPAGGILDMTLDDVGSSFARGLTISGVIINEILEVTSGTVISFEFWARDDSVKLYCVKIIVVSISK
jgi:hypothetical protein